MIPRDPWMAHRERRDRLIFGPPKPRPPKPAPPPKPPAPPLPVACDGMPHGLRPVPWPEPGTTNCSRGEICGTRHPLAGEHLVTAQPVTEWTRGQGRPW